MLTGRGSHTRRLESHCESRETAPYCGVERLLVLLGDVRLERRPVRVTDLGESLSSRLDEVEVLRVLLLGLLAPGPVVRPLGRFARVDQVAVVLHEEAELPLDQIVEPAHTISR